MDNAVPLGFVVGAGFGAGLAHVKKPEWYAGNYPTEAKFEHYMALDAVLSGVFGAALVALARR